MELPYELREAIERQAQGASQHELKELTGELSRRYRDETGQGRRLVSRDAEALAYAVARMPATYCAVRAALEAAWQCMPGLDVHTLLDVGAGTGAASWAALTGPCAPERLTLIEREDAMSRLGQQLMQHSQTWAGHESHWLQANLSRAAPEGQYDMVVAAYMLGELDEVARMRLLDALWAATGALLLIVEPGTPEGSAQLRRMREHILELGGHVAAPCPHERECPLADGDWCHFTCRVARSRLHRLLKGGDAPYEDEKFSYMAFTRTPAQPCAARVRRHPTTQSGRVTLELCTEAGLERRTVLKRDGSAFKAARKADCGDAFDF